MPISFEKFLAEYDLVLRNYILKHGAHPLFVYEARKQLDLDQLTVLGLALVFRDASKTGRIRELETRIARRAMGIDGK